MLIWFAETTLVGTALAAIALVSPASVPGWGRRRGTPCGLSS